MSTHAEILKMTKAELTEYVVATYASFGEVCVTGFAQHSKDELQREALDLRERQAHDEMAVAMSREPDPSTDNGYGPRAVND